MMYPPPAPWAPPMVPVQPMSHVPGTSADGPAERPLRGFGPDRYARVAGIAVIAVTVLAVVLAALGPALAGQLAPAAVPSGWAKVYDAALSDDGSWDTPGGCRFTSDGMHITGSSVAATGCVFRPSSTRDLTSQGVQVSATVAPAADVRGAQDAAIVLGADGTTISLDIDQEGQYRLCSPGAAQRCISDSTVAWHTDGFVANTLTLRYVDGVVTAYANGQQIAQRAAGLPSGLAIALDAPPQSEALFTHATIYSASGS